MNKVVGVTGANGRLGKVLVDRFGCVDLGVDVTWKHSICMAVDLYKPDVIINCAAYTDVDGAEVEKGDSLSINAVGISNIRQVFSGQVIHLSTDFIFSGEGGPYREGSIPNPINWYGKTKLIGEQLLLDFGGLEDVVVRTTVLFGGHKPDFATTVLGKLKSGQSFTLPRNLFGNPTHVFHLAMALMRIVDMKSPPQILNVAGAAWMSRYDFGVMLANKFGYDSKLIQYSSEVPGAAKRPKLAGLNIRFAKSLNLPIYSIQDAVNQFFIEKANVYGQYPTK